MHTQVDGMNFVSISGDVTGVANEATENHYLMWYGQVSTTGTPKVEDEGEEEGSSRLLQNGSFESFAIVQQITKVAGETPEYQVFPYFFEGDSSLVGTNAAFRVLNKADYVPEGEQK